MRDGRTPATGMPLVQALLRNASSGRVPFHMPGHAGGSAFPGWLSAALASFDTTELPWTDDLNHPAGPAKEAMEKAAQAFGAGWTRFVTSGATTAILSMVAAACPIGSRVLVQRTCHRSVVSAAALLGLDPVPVAPLRAEDAANPRRAPRKGRWSAAPFGPLSPEDVEDALRREPDVRAVVVTSPDYYGTASDLAALAAAAHAHGALLLVDEAHGAHFAFTPGAPKPALACGADLVVHSAHKTLPALTQAALLHVSRDALRSGRVDPDRVEAALRAFHTSSPSFPVAASLDYARATLESSAAAIRARTKAVRELCAALAADASAGRLPAAPVADLFGTGRDPLRIVLTVDATDPAGPAGASGPTGFAVARRLAARGIAVEMADPERIVLLPALFPTADGAGSGASGTSDLEDLAEALPGALAGGPDGEAPPPPWILPRSAFADRLAAPAERVLSPVVAFDGTPRAAVLLERAVGRVLAEPFVPYPPGIPLLWPGERLDADRAALAQALLAQGATVSGLAAGRIACLPMPGEALL